MSLFKKFSVLGIMLFAASCASNAAFPDISDEVGTIRKSEGLASDGARKASVPEEDPAEKAAEEAKKAEAEKAKKAAEAAKKAEAEKEAESEEVKLISNEEFMSKAEKLEGVRTKPVKKSESKYAVDDSADEERYSEIFGKEPEEKTAEPAQPEKDEVPSITYRLDTFYFNNGSSNLDEEERARIRNIVKIAKKNDAKIRVLGYASSRTRNTDIATHKLMNFRVSQARADAVAKALVRAGLPASDITVEALSDSNPAYLEVMPEGERLNRRAEVYISY